MLNSQSMSTPVYEKAQKNLQPEQDSYQESDEDEYYKDSVVQDMPVFEKSPSFSPIKKLVSKISRQNSEVVLDPLDLIERGMGRNRKHQDFTIPPDSDSMRYCQMHKLNGKRTEYMMFMEYENERQFQKLKLYAKFKKNEWLIYPYDPTDPYYKEDEYLFKLIVENKNYYLWSTNCESCSLKYKTSCVSTVKHREQLLVGQNYSQNLNGAGLNLFRAYIPKLDLERSPQSPNPNGFELQRNVWCPSTLRADVMSPLILKSSYSLKQINRNKITDKEIPDDAIFVHSKLPEWSTREKCWIMQSYGRIAMASKRNFQLRQNYEPEQIIFQMGKLKKGIYILDYRRPLCFVQAFAIGLATNEWKSTV